MAQNLTLAIGFLNQILSCRICNIGPHKKTDPFIKSKSKNLKLGIGSDRIRISHILMSQCGGTGLMSYRSYRSVRYLYESLYRTYQRVRYRYLCCTDTGTTSGTDVHTGTSGTGIDVPNLTKCPIPVLIPPVPVLMYRT